MLQEIRMIQNHLSDLNDKLCAQIGIAPDPKIKLQLQQAEDGISRAVRILGVVEMQLIKGGKNGK